MKTDLPHGFVPFKEVNVCSNRVVESQVLFAFEDRPVLLVGRNGAVPRVWLGAPLGRDPEGWRILVEDNTSRLGALTIRVDERARTVTFSLGGTVLLVVIKLSDDLAIVPMVDLRPVGLAIYGDAASLHVARATLANNTLTNIHTAVKLGA